MPSFSVVLTDFGSIIRMQYSFASCVINVGRLILKKLEMASKREERIKYTRAYLTIE